MQLLVATIRPVYVAFGRTGLSRDLDLDAMHCSDRDLALDRPWETALLKDGDHDLDLSTDEDSPLDPDLDLSAGDFDALVFCFLEGQNDLLLSTLSLCFLCCNLLSRKLVKDIISSWFFCMVILS